MIRRIGDLDPPKCTHPEHGRASHEGLSAGRYEATCSGCGHTFFFDVTPWSVMSLARLAERDRRAKAGHPETIEELSARLTVPPEMRQYVQGASYDIDGEFG